MRVCQPVVINETDAEICEEHLIRCMVLICENEGGTEGFTPTLMLCSDADMRRYNRQFRGVDAVTDVLCFVGVEQSQGLQQTQQPEKGCDIVIDIKQIDRQKGSNTLNKELLIVLIHGILHAFGYDHIRTQDESLMRERELYYLNLLEGNPTVSDGLFYLIALFFVLSAFFSGTETAFFSLSRIYLKKLENINTASARRILSLLKKPRRLLITLLLGNVFVNMAISSLTTLFALDLNDGRLAESTVVTIQVIVTTFLIVTFGEIIPKLVALSTASAFARIASLPILFFRIILFPFVWLLEQLSLLASRKQGSDKHLAEHFTTEEFHNLIQSETSKHGLEEHEKKMLVGLFRFREATLTEIYVPRVKIQAIEEKQSLDELRDLILACGFSRIPVFRETIDDIVGIIYVKDLLLYPERKKIVDFMRPPMFVTENMKVQTLLNQFKTRKLQVAVVVDEYGGTSGIISLEDILEEIVGEIQDEYDHDETPEISPLDADTFKVSGICNIRQFNHEFSVSIDPSEFDNVAEFLLSEFNHVPATGESFILDNTLEFIVLESDDKSIKTVSVRRINDET